MISIEHGVDVIHYFSHLIRAKQSCNSKFINGAKRLEALLVFAEDSYRGSGWNRIPLIIGYSGVIRYRHNKILASYDLKLKFERQYDIFWWKRGATTWKRGVPDWECCLEMRSAQRVLEDGGMKLNGAYWRLWSTDRDRWAPTRIEECQQGLRSANRDWGAPRLVAAHRNVGWGVLIDLHKCCKWGVRSAETNWAAPIKPQGHQWGLTSSIPSSECQPGKGVRIALHSIGATILTEVSQWEFGCSYPKLRSTEWGELSAEKHWGAPIQTVGIKECLSQWRSTERTGTHSRMKEKSNNLGWGAPMDIEEGLF